MKFVLVTRTFRGAREGWVTRGTIFNVGIEYRPGLAVMDEARARELIRATYVREYKEGEPVVQPEKEDPIRQRNERMAAQRARAESKRAQAPASKVRKAGSITMTDNRRQTKVDPPPQRKAPAAPPAPVKGGKQPVNPPAPRRAGAASQTSTAPAHQPTPTSTPGGQTGAAPTSPSSAEAGPAPKRSTGGPRGIRRGTEEHKARSASSQSTKRGASSQAPTPSTAPIGAGGTPAKDADSSKD